MTKTEATDYRHRKQKFKFEVELSGVGWDFSLGLLNDELRKAISPALAHITPDTKVSILSIALEE